MQYPEYNVKFTSEQPQVGIQCPVCREGIIEGNDFTDKSGKQWYSVICRKCFTKWLSKYPPQKAKEESEVMIIDEISELRKHFDERLDKLATYLKKKLGDD